MRNLRDRLLGTEEGRTRSPGAISQFEAFRHGPEGPRNPFAGLQQATAPMANAGVASLNGAPTATAPTGGAGGGSALSTGAPIGTMAHAGGGGPFTFGFPFGIEGDGDLNEDIGEAGGAGEDSGGGGGEDDSGDGDEG